MFKNSNYVATGNLDFYSLRPHAGSARYFYVSLQQKYYTESIYLFITDIFYVYIFYIKLANSF
jgi:hypothetical protein